MLHEPFCGQVGDFLQRAELFEKMGGAGNQLHLFLAAKLLQGLFVIPDDGFIERASAGTNAILTIVPAVLSGQLVLIPAAELERWVQRNARRIVPRANGARLQRRSSC